MGQLEVLLSSNTRILAITHVSNALGTIVPLKKIIDAAHDAGAVVLVDGAQAIAHMGVDVVSLDCDFYAFSSHKVFGPTGVGILYGKHALLEEMAPYQGGGDMIRSVTFEETVYNDVPYKFEAGTPNIAGAIGLAVALDYISNLGPENIGAYEDVLLRDATEKLLSVPGVRLIGTAEKKAGILSFHVEGLPLFGYRHVARSSRCCDSCRASLRYAGHGALWLELDLSCLPRPVQQCR